MRPQRKALGAIGAGADRGVAARIERLQRDGGVVDAHHFADLLAIAGVDADAFAQPHEAREAGDAIMRGRDLGDDAADARRGSVRRPSAMAPRGARARCAGAVAGFDGWARRGRRSCAAPSVLIASCTKFGLRDFVGDAVESRG